MRNQPTLDRVSEELTRNCGDWLAAARAAGVSLAFVRQWMKDDPTAAATLQEAHDVGVQGLYSAAVQRAVHGVEEGVYYKGTLVATETKYSDALLTTLLKGKLTDFKPLDAQAPTLTVNIANLMPRASSYDEWLSMRDQTLKIAHQPEHAIDATFEPLHAFTGIDL